MPNICLALPLMAGADISNGRTNTPRLFCSAGQNVGEGHQFVRADECADALDQKNQSEEKEKGDPVPADMGLTPQPEDDQKRDQPDGNGQCSDPIHAGSGIKATHVQLPLGSRRQRAVKRPAGADPATGLAKLAAGRGIASRCRSLVSRRNPRAGLVTSRQTFVRRCHRWMRRARFSRRVFNERLRGVTRQRQELAAAYHVVGHDMPSPAVRLNYEPRSPTDPNRSPHQQLIGRKHHSGTPD